MEYEATHRVRDAEGKPIGFLVNERFINNYTVAHSKHHIKNLVVLKNGSIRVKAQLSEMSYKELMEREYHDLIIENPFKRDIQEVFKCWKNDGGDVIIQLHGPRQCGKTVEIQRFAYENYENVVYINMAEEDGKLFEQIMTGRDIGELIDPLDYFCELSNRPRLIDNKNTILIIDEIQESYKVYNTLRKLRNRYSIDIMVTGSYLGELICNEKFFLPAGTIDIVEMLPLSFREFVRTFDKEELLDSISLYGESNEDDYKELFELYHIYKQIGGYPDVVKEFMRSHDINRCNAIIEKILKIFIGESSKYNSVSKAKHVFKTLFDYMIKVMCSGNRGNETKIVEELTKSISSETKPFITKSDVNNSLAWFLESKVLGACDLCLDGNILSIFAARRFYYLNCGITNYLCNMTRINESAVQGLLSETFAFNELARLYLPKLYLEYKVKGGNPYFSTLGNYELDFMIIGKDNAIYGLEVKTGNSSAKSLSEYVKRGLVDKGIVANNSNGSKGARIDTIPIWAIGARFPY